MNSFMALTVRAGSWLSMLPPAPQGTRLMGAADLHLTVAFLGGLAEARARHAFETLARDPVERVFATLGAVVPLGHPRRPSALSALVEGRTDSGQALDEAIRGWRDRALVAAELAPEERDPLPHITLARLGRSAVARRDGLDWAARIDLERASVQLDRFALYRTRRERSDRLFEILDSVELGV